MINLNTIIMAASKNLPTILSGMALATSAMAVVEGCKATVKANETLQKMHYESEEEPSTKEKFCAVAPLYTKTGIFLLMTWAEILGAQIENDKKIAVLTGLLHMKEQELEDTEKKVKELFGEKKVEQVKQEIVKDKVKANPPTDEGFYDTGVGSTKFRDGTLGGDWLSDIENVKFAFNEINNQLSTNRGCNIISANDLMDALNRPRMDMGNRLVWMPGDVLDVRIQQEEYCSQSIYDTEEKELKDIVWVITYNPPHEINDDHI